MNAPKYSEIKYWIAGQLILSVIILLIGTIQYHKRVLHHNQLEELQRKFHVDGGLLSTASPRIFEALRQRNAALEASKNALLKRSNGRSDTFLGSGQVQLEDWYFDLLAMLERLKKSADQHGVIYGQNFSFGLEPHVQGYRIVLANQKDEALAPYAKKLTKLQHDELETILKLLFSARPEHLENVVLEDLRRASGSDSYTGKDMIGNTASLVSLEYSITFVSKTESLRGFLNAVSILRDLWVIRNIQVGPADSMDMGKGSGFAFTAPTRSLADVSEVVPVVGENTSRFVVSLCRYVWVEGMEPHWSH